MEDRLDKKLGYNEIKEKYGSSNGGVQSWERIYREEGLQDLYTELIDYLDYCNNRRIKEKQKGLSPTIHRQQAFLTA